MLQISLNSGCLVVAAILVYALMHPTNLKIDQHPVSLLDTPPLKEPTYVSILPPINSTPLTTFSLLNTPFLLCHLLRPLPNLPKNHLPRPLYLLLLRLNAQESLTHVPPATPMHDPSLVPDLVAPRSTHSMTTRSRNNIHKTNPRYCLTSTLRSIIEPSSVTQATTDVRWRNAMSAEFNTLLKNDTWDLVLPNP